jgi:hypothetical protein
MRSIFRAPLDWVFRRAVVNRAQLRVEVSAVAQDLCSVAGVCGTTLGTISHHTRAGSHRRRRDRSREAAIRAVCTKGDIDGYRVGNVGSAVAGPHQRHHLDYYDRNLSKPLDRSFLELSQPASSSTVNVPPALLLT